MAIVQGEARHDLGDGVGKCPNSPDVVREFC